MKIDRIRNLSRLNNTFHVPEDNNIRRYTSTIKR